MERSEFEELRDLPNKRITVDVVLRRKKIGSVVFKSLPVPILGDDGPIANLHVTFNEATEEKNINVTVVGVGPICRLDVDSNLHAPAGRSHKHALLTPDCPSENLRRQLTAREDLAGLPVDRVFAIFCEMAHIEHTGNFSIPS
jgi:hypothetical protein